MFKSDDDEQKAPRQLIPLDITEEERRAAAEYQQPMDEAAEALALAQQQARAISAALAAAKAAAGMSAAPAPAATAENKGSTKGLSHEDTLKLKQKQLVDQIPTTKYVAGALSIYAAMCIRLIFVIPNEGTIMG